MFPRENYMSELRRLWISRQPMEYVKVHSTAVMLGFHPSDDVEAVTTLCKCVCAPARSCNWRRLTPRGRDLAEMTGGVYRTVVHVSGKRCTCMRGKTPNPRCCCASQTQFVPEREKVDMEHLHHERPPLRAPKHGRPLQGIIVASYLFMLLMNVLAQELPFGVRCEPPLLLPRPLPHGPTTESALW